MRTEIKPDDAPKTPDPTPALQKWLDEVGGGRKEFLRGRLNWDGVEAGPSNPDAVISCVLPGVRLEASADFLQALEAVGRTSVSEDVGDRAFGEFYAPFVALTLQRLRARCRTTLLDEGALLGLFPPFLDTLEKLSAGCLELEFRAWKAVHRRRDIAAVLAEAEGDDGQYTRFMAEVCGARTREFLQTYPVLGGLLERVCEGFVTAGAWLISRLQTDYPLLEETFGAGKELGTVRAFEAGMSDRHFGGLAVVRVDFSSGVKVMYKPRPVDAEAGFSALIAFLNERSGDVQIAMLPVLPRGEYGWMAFAEHRECDTREALERYYERAGMLLALVYLLDGTDCHAENIVAMGEHPVLVDTEMLFHQQEESLIGFAHTAADRPAARAALHSVLQSGLLPRWQMGENGTVYDTSGFGATSGQETPFEKRVWQAPNTDRMRSARVPAETTFDKNLPRWRGRQVPPVDYLDSLSRGFAGCYRLILENREALLDAGGGWQRYRGAAFRFVYRPTRFYRRVLEHTITPKLLSDPLAYAMALDGLCTHLLDSTEKPRAWPLMRAERVALSRFDIPYFGWRTGRRDLLPDTGEVVENFFAEDAFDRVTARLGRLNLQDMQHQMAIAKGAVLTGTRRLREHEPEVAVGISDEGVPLEREEALREARQIGQILIQHALRGDAGTLDWLTFRYNPAAGVYQQGPMRFDLYEGYTGVALFFAALERVFRDGEFGPLARASMAPVIGAIQQEGGDALQGIDLGAGTGMGSLIYGLTHLDRLLDEGEFLDSAVSLARLIEPNLISSDENPDVVKGTAGALLGLLTLYDRLPESFLLPRLTACGEAILSRIPGEAALAAASEPRLLAGFSHGAAGIAYALLRLWSVTKEDRFVDRAKALLGYEHGLFNAEEGEWPDLRPSVQAASGGAGFSSSWCHGSPGVGIARLMGSKYFQTAETADDIQAAVSRSGALGLKEADNACCGNFGRIEWLLLAAERLGRPDLSRQAARFARLLLMRARRDGGYRMVNHLPAGVFNPAFFQGAAGIGYTFLRLAAPKVLPCVLAFE